MPVFTTLAQHGAGSSRHCNQARQWKAYRTKGRHETVLICRWHSCLGRKPPGIYEKPLGTSKFSKVARSTYTNKLHFYLLTINMQEWKLKTMPFTVIPKKMKYLGISNKKYTGSVYWK